MIENKMEKVNKNAQATAGSFNKNVQFTTSSQENTSLAKAISPNYSYTNLKCVSEQRCA